MKKIIFWPMDKYLSGIKVHILEMLNFLNIIQNINDSFKVYVFAYENINLENKYNNFQVVKIKSNNRISKSMNAKYWSSFREDFKKSVLDIRKNDEIIINCMFPTALYSCIGFGKVNVWWRNEPYNPLRYGLFRLITDKSLKSFIHSYKNQRDDLKVITKADTIYCVSSKVHKKINKFSNKTKYFPPKLYLDSIDNKIKLSNQLKIAWISSNIYNKKKHIKDYFKTTERSFSNKNIQWYIITNSGDYTLVKENINYKFNICRNDILNLYENFDILISTSIYEQFGYQIIEAMTRGVIPLVRHSLAQDDFFGEYKNEFCYKSNKELFYKLDLLFKNQAKINHLSKIVKQLSKNFIWTEKDLEMIIK
jgi:hypothetical protein